MNDVRTMAKVLIRTGFIVTKLEIVSYNKMRETISEFGQQLRKADVALFLLLRAWDAIGRKQLASPYELLVLHTTAHSTPRSQ